MKDFDFERYTPPMLNEKRLREIERKRRFRKEIFWVVLCSVVMQVCTLAVGLLLMEESPVMATSYLSKTTESSLISVIVVLICAVKKRRRST
ncbi:MAG: hypothetical protein IJW87_04440 [Clostridia bacterium]|nr:hypothetical protein [Clostridia bacterium]